MGVITKGVGGGGRVEMVTTWSPLLVLLPVAGPVQISCCWPVKVSPFVTDETVGLDEAAGLHSL